MNKTRKYFGTDGIRGSVGDGPITPDFILKLGWAVGRVLADGHNSKVLIGKDTRISGYMFESALEAGLSAAGVDIDLLGPIPTPAVAYLTRTFRAQAGIVISASHNPYYDNGIKFFSAEGSKLADEIELAIEAELEKPMTIVDSKKLGKAVRIEDARGRYIEFCKSTIPQSVTLNDMKIVLDCAHGATYHVAPDVLHELGATVIEMAVEPNGLNINDNCGSTSPHLLQQRVLQEKADLGIAFDGDGDRVIMVDNKGNIVDGDDILFIIAKEAVRSGKMSGGVVGTLMSNLGLEMAIKALGLEFMRAKVGDRYVMEMMRQQGWQLGGETSGHIICLNMSTTGDGIIAALQVLAAMQQTESTLYELHNSLEKFPQVLVNVKTNGIMDLNQPAIQQAVQEAQAQLANTGRVLLRPSGTEPVVRVMVEGKNDSQVRKIADELAKVVERAS